MWKIVALQWAVGLGLSAGLMWISPTHALSAFWGAVAVALPSSLFALRLSMVSRSESIAGVTVFLAGEFLKIVGTVLMLALVAKLLPALVWWALMLSVVLTIKSYFLIFLLK
jgi:ATP synthase protein I